ncbi:hypothetical protein B0J18DRAFT_132718 [Chaetomium sp. MPI-SDFR-AT-0129]|nr:hypothetical protein B0J18DRAFT_132718 [Chaetomium sp. MPI-SDFR-AT-0129]
MRLPREARAESSSLRLGSNSSTKHRKGQIHSCGVITGSRHRSELRLSPVVTFKTGAGGERGTARASSMKKTPFISGFTFDRRHTIRLHTRETHDSRLFCLVLSFPWLCTETGSLDGHLSGHVSPRSSAEIVCKWPLATRPHTSRRRGPLRDGSARTSPCNAVRALRNRPRQHLDVGLFGHPSSRTLYHRFASAVFGRNKTSLAKSNKEILQRVSGMPFIIVTQTRFPFPEWRDS